MIYVIVGPTASGKSALALAFAQRIGGQLINGDAFQVYQGLQIGTAKPSLKDREQVIHHLYDFVPLSVNYNVRDYQADLRKKIAELQDKHVPIILVGGTGLYVRAGLYDYEFKDNVPVDMTPFLSMNNDTLFAHLQSIDPTSASKTHANNRKRVLRAIEIYYATGETKSAMEERQKHHLLYEATFVGLDYDRETLYTRINHRVETMFAQGLMDEATRLFASYNPANHAFQAIGYKEIYQGLLHTLPKEMMIQTIQQNTRNYAKRQMTFFKHQLPVTWFKDAKDALEYLVEVYEKKSN